MRFYEFKADGSTLAVRTINRYADEIGKDSMDYDMFKKSAELLDKQMLKSLAQHIENSDTSPKEYVMKVISKSSLPGLTPGILKAQPAKAHLFMMHSPNTTRGSLMPSTDWICLMPTQHLMPRSTPQCARSLPAPYTLMVSLLHAQAIRVRLAPWGLHAGVMKL